MNTAVHRPDLTIVIPQYNEVELTIQAIESLRRHELVIWPILVIDNGSEPRSLRQLSTQSFPSVTVRTLPRAGLTAAWNIASHHVTTESILFLNNDTVTTGPWVESLISPIRDQLSPISAPELRTESHVSPPVDLPAGWCFAVRRSALEAVGGFNESLALYFSDTDFFLQMRQRFPERPWSIVPDLPLTHLAHRTAHRLPDRKQNWLADRDQFLARWKRGTPDAV